MNQISSGNKALTKSNHIPLVASKPYSDVRRATKSAVMEADFTIIEEPVQIAEPDKKNEVAVREEATIVFDGDGLWRNFIFFAMGCVVMYALTRPSGFPVVAAIVAAFPINLIFGMIVESKFMLYSKWRIFLSRR